MKFTEICGLDLGSLSLLVGAAAAVVSGRVCVCVCVCVCPTDIITLWYRGAVSEHGQWSSQA